MFKLIVDLKIMEVNHCRGGSKCWIVDGLGRIKQLYEFKVHPQLYLRCVLH